MKTRCRTDLPLFARYFFPEICRLDWSRLHRLLFLRRAEKTALDPPDRRGQIDVVLAPRGAAKSTLTSLVFPIHAALHGLDHYILLISATQRQASTRLNNIRDALLTGARLREFYGAEIGPGRLGGARAAIVNSVKIDAFSAGSEIRGVTHGAWRPTWIVLDDVENGVRILGSAYREMLAEWMREVVENLGNGYTNIDLIGTLLHRDALPARLAERPDVRFECFQSIVREADDQGLWREWSNLLFDLSDPDRLARARAFFDARRDAMLRGAEALWPEKESYYDLCLMRAARGPRAFNKEKQNIPPNDEEAVFPPGRLARFRVVGDRLVHLGRDASAGLPNSTFTIPNSQFPTGGAASERELNASGLACDRGAQKRADAPPPAPEGALSRLRVFGFLDPAIGDSEQKGRSKSGDFAAIVTAGVDPSGYVYVLDAWLERAGASAQIPRIFDLHAVWGYREFGVETNAFQRFLLDPLEIEREARRRARQPWDAPVRAIRSRGSKRERIASLEPLVRAGWILFNESLPEELINQLADFPHARHDDGPDALQAAVALARGSTAAARVEKAPAMRAPGKTRSF